MHQRKNGVWERKIKDEYGKPKSFYGATEREVRKKIKEYERRLSRTTCTLGEIIKMRSEEEAPNWSPNTIRAVETVQHRISDTLLATNIDEIKAREITAELKRLADMGYSQSTIKAVRGIISSAFKWAMQEDYCESSPMEAVRTPKAPAKKRAATTDEDAQTIIDVRNDGEINFFVYLTLVTGMRRSEAAAITWDDIDFENREITVNKQLCIDTDGVTVYAKKPKSEAGTRTIPMIDMLYDDLKARHDEGRQHVVNICYKSISYQMRRYREDYGLSPDWSLHADRHAFATQCVRSGVDVKTAQTILGHSDISMTLGIYAETTRDMRSDAAKKLGKKLLQKSIS